MANGSKIEWTEATWNPVTGCTKISPGCKHCYAERFSIRLQAMGVAQYRNAFSPTLHPDSLQLPLRWKKPRRVFVNSMSDLFHESVPLDFIKRVFGVMVEASHHQFQVLTKRPEVALEFAGRLPWPDNVWLGTSVENALYVHRIRTLQKIPAKIRFLSVEPLLGPIPRLPLRRIHWVIVGGESGPGARKIQGAGSYRSATNAAQRESHFSLSSGVVSTRSAQVDPWTDERGMNYRATRVSGS